MGRGELLVLREVFRLLFSPGQASIRVRFLLFQPGGPLALELSRHSVVLLVNETLFAHGGILPHHGTHADMAEGGGL